MPEPESLDTEAAAAFLGLSAATLTTWRSRPGKTPGPRYAKLGRRVTYLVADLRAWRDSMLVSTTAEAAANGSKAGAA